MLPLHSTPLLIVTISNLPVSVKKNIQSAKNLRIFPAGFRHNEQNRGMAPVEHPAGSGARRGMVSAGNVAAAMVLRDTN